MVHKHKKKTAESAVALMVRLSDRSGEKPYCTFIICIRFHSVNTYFENVYQLILLRLNGLYLMPLGLFNQIVYGMWTNERTACIDTWDLHRIRILHSYT